MKHLPYKILIKDNESVKKARKWCRNRFGPQPTKYIRALRGKPGRQRYLEITRIYDRENCRWYNRVSSNPVVFYFKNEIDAFEFKLRWR